MLGNTIVRATLATCLLFCNLSFAKDPIVLFKDGRPVHDYTERVAALQEGDTIVFSDGKSFTIQGILGGRTEGQGRVSLVFDVGNGEALRIAKGVGQIPRGDLGHTYEAFMQYFHYGYKALHEGGVHTVKVLDSGFGPNSDTPEYTRVAKMNMAFKLSDYLKNPDMSLPEGLTRAGVEKAMETFFVSTADFSHIGDFAAEQVGWNTDTQRFELFDWSTLHQRVMQNFTHGYSSPFDKIYRRLDPILRERIRDAIASARRFNVWCGSRMKAVADQVSKPPGPSSDPYSTQYESQ